MVALVNLRKYNSSMRILTLDNSPYDLDHLPEEVDDMRLLS